MTTKYSDLKPPWSSIQVEFDRPTKLHIWVYGKKSGELVFGPEDKLAMREALLTFKGKTVASMHFQNNGIDKIPIALVHLRPSRTDIVISDHGEVRSLKNMIEIYSHDDNFGLNPIPKSDEGWFK